VYYGWIVLAAGALGMMFSIPGQTVGVSVFTDHLIAALGLTRIQLSSAYMAGTLASALLMTRAGRIFDRLGARCTAAGAVVFLALLLILLTRIDRWTAAAASVLGSGAAVAAGAAFAAAALGFLGIRFFGQGVLTLVSRTMVMRWFEERRGRVAAWFGVSISAGFSYAPRLLQLLIDKHGWRGAWIVLAGSLILVALPLVLVLFRDSPERCGIPMEDGLRHLKIHKDRLDHQGPDATLAEARRDPRYWAYNLMMGWWSMYTTAFTFHVVDLFASRGLGAADAVAIFLPITVVSVAFNFLGSWASDAVDLPPLYFIALAGFAAAGAAIVAAGAAWSRVLLIAGYGVGAGFWSVLTNVTWPRLYGREHLGEISGSAMTFLVAGSALGPWVFSLLRSDAGGYVGAGIFGVAGPALLAVFGVAAFVGRRLRAASPARP